MACACICIAIACDSARPRLDVTRPATPAETLTVAAPAETLTVSAPADTLTVPAPAETLTVSAAPNVFAAASAQALLPSILSDADTTGAAMIWSSSDEGIAVVNQMGMVVGRTAGTAVVRGSIGKSLSFTSVQVVPPEDSPLRIIAHRGFMRLFPENTIVAVRGAFDHHADAVEVDIRLSADGVPVVMHDETVDRTTTGHGAVSALTTAELATLNACVRWAGVAPCAVPLMTDVLREAHGRGGVVLHLYGHFTPDDLRRMLTAVRDAGMDRDAVFISFDYSVLLTLRQLDPVAALGLLTTHPPDTMSIEALKRTAPLIEFQAAIADSTATRAYLLEAGRLHEDIGVWVAWDQAQAKRAAALGFRTIIADVPIDRAALVP